MRSPFLTVVSMKTFIANQNKKLSKIISSYCDGLSYQDFRKALRNKDIKVNDKRISNDIVLSVGDRVDVYYLPKKHENFSKIYIDDNVLVINKKSGVTSEQIFEEISKEYKSAGFIHRLDRNTSGVMIFSLNVFAEKELLLGFKNRTFTKEYEAEVVGVPIKKKATLEGYLIKDEKASTVKIYSTPQKGASYIKTGYEVISSNEETSKLKVILYTGKTHQIRAHLSYAGYPLVGDGKYGDNQTNRRLKKKTQQLTAKKLILKFNESDYLYYLNGREFCVE